MTPRTTPRATAAARPVWHTSSYSNAEGGNCVEVARADRGAGSGAGAGSGSGTATGPGPRPGAVPVRDAKYPHGPALFFGPVAWSSFVGALKASRRPAGLP
ncbi:DUF397 domain-containing protein [Streptomyces winkii]|uniref:DUF397 domain-containing protein n=1 Tax=Streptomyces winkii TaxID=3051178 RepID=UPI0028D5C6E2|nr:DUF397 domain-containing protein [Streptomyces sp. DSM 40971]